MFDIALEASAAERVSLWSLFVAFLTVSLCGFGGGLVWARRIAVEQRHWISEPEFVDIVSLCQFMPGPNIVGIAVCMGTKLRGGIGAVAALCGFVVVPWAIGFSLGTLYLEYAHLAILRNALGGVAAAAAGLLLGAGIRLLLPHRTRPISMLFIALAFALMAFTKLPLPLVLLGLVPLSTGFAGLANARAK
jgi:chromate transporter